MNRRQLFFLVLVNALVSLVIAVVVAWVFEARRPDPEELAAINTPRPQPVLALPAGGESPAQPVVPSPAEAEPTPIPPTPTPEPEPVDEVYVVQPGDTLLAIATRFGVTVDSILAANNLTNPDFVFAGQRLVIPLMSGAARPTATPQARAASSASIQLTSIQNPGDLANEQILVINESDTAVSLQGWRLERSDGPTYIFRSDTPLFPGGSLRVHSRAGTDTTIDLYWGLTEAVWRSGVTAQLRNAQGEIVASLRVP